MRSAVIEISQPISQKIEDVIWIGFSAVSHNESRIVW